MQLPDRLKARVATVHPFTLRISIKPHAGVQGFTGMVDLVKHFAFQSPVPVKEAKDLCSGMACLIRIGTYKK
eukprot:12418514-Karenia_brevis.AAC.1